MSHHVPICTRFERTWDDSDTSRLLKMCFGDDGVFATSELPHIRIVPKGTQLFSGYATRPSLETATLERVWKPSGFNEGGIGTRDNPHWVTFFGDELTAKGYADWFVVGSTPDAHKKGVIHEFETKRDLRVLCVTSTFQDAHEVSACICAQHEFDGSCVLYSNDIMAQCHGPEIALCDPRGLLTYVRTQARDPRFSGVWKAGVKMEEASRPPLGAQTRSSSLARSKSRGASRTKQVTQSYPKHKKRDRGSTATLVGTHNLRKRAKADVFPR
jgi:hypothetical protein